MINSHLGCVIFDQLVTEVTHELIVLSKIFLHYCASVTGALTKRVNFIGQINARLD